MAITLGAIAAGSRLAEWALVAQLGLLMLKGVNRATLAKAELPSSKPWFDRHGWVFTWWAPAASWFWLISLAASALERKATASVARSPVL